MGDHSWFWSQERKGQNHLGSRMKEQTKGLRTHHKTVVLMKVERTDKKTFLRSEPQNCFLASLRISLPILLATDPLFSSLSILAGLLCLPVGCGLRPLGGDRGREGEKALWPLTMPTRKGDPGCQSTGSGKGP